MCLCFCARVVVCLWKARVCVQRDGGSVQRSGVVSMLGECVCVWACRECVCHRWCVQCGVSVHGVCVCLLLLSATTETHTMNTNTTLHMFFWHTSRCEQNHT